MKETVKRLFALVLVLTMVCSMLPVNALATETESEDSVSFQTESRRMINPLYKDVITEDDLEWPERSPVQTLAEPVYLTDVSQMAQILREGMKARQETITIYYQSETFDEDAIWAVVDSIWAEALKHTGNPTEGDYLQWQYGGMEYSISPSVQGGMYNFQIDYVILYYTTLAQEEALDAAITSLISSLNLTGKSNYEKVKAVYDYICANVTYDDANLNNDAYTLKYTAYAALQNKTAVCQGYALLLYRLALELGIDCRIIAGIGGGGAHGWNIIGLGDLYYNLDSTWDAEYSQNGLNYAYFLKSDANFADHARYTQYASESFYASYPMASADFDPSTDSDSSEEPGGTEDAAITGTCGENLTWKLDDKGILTISGTGEMEYQGYDRNTGKYMYSWVDYLDDITGVVIESGVTSVADGAFYGHAALTTVELPDTVTGIGNSAFYGCTSLEEVSIPAAVTDIESKAFGGCSALEGIWVHENNDYYASDAKGVLYNKEMTLLCQAPGSLTGAYEIVQTATELNGGSFEGCSKVTSVVIPDGVWLLDLNLFNNCTALEYVSIPNSVTSIESAAFQNCSSLKEITIPAKVSSVGPAAFANCTGLEKITFLGDTPACDGEIFTGVTANAYYPADNTTWTTEKMQSYGGTIAWSTEGAVEIVTSGTCGENLTWTLDSNGVLTISGTGDMAVFNYESSVPWASYVNEVTSVVVESGVTSISDYAFRGCVNLITASLPEGITAIGKNAFYNCKLLTRIVIPDTVTTIGNTAFNYCSALTDVTIGSGVTKIGNSAFAWCSGLTSIDIPDSVLSIGTYAFSKCSALERVTIGKGLKEISNSMFNECKKLSAIEIPGNVTKIDTNAFSSCTALTDITLSEGIETIGATAFISCSGLTELVIPASVTSIADDATKNCTKLTKITVDGDNEVYCNDTYGVVYTKDMKTLVQMGAGFAGAYEIPDTVTSIANYAFYYCTGLTSVTIPAGVTTIGDYAFGFCRALTSIDLPDGTTEIGQYAFYQCRGLASIDLGKSLTEIGAYAFYYCEELDSISIPNTVKMIGAYALKDCYDLVKVTIPDSVTSMGSGVFQNSSLLEQVIFGDGVTTIGDYMFSSCSNLLSVTLGSNVTKISNHAFYYCRELSEITVPALVTEIGSNAFDGCFALTKVTFTGDAPTIASNSFNGLTLTAGYPDDETWTEDMLQQYGGTITWVNSGEPSQTPSERPSNACGENLTWTFDESTGTLTISGTGAMDDYYIDEYLNPQTPWMDHILDVATLVIGEGVTHIGDYAFYHLQEMTRITMADTVTSIGVSAFEGCYELPAIELSENLVTISDRAFYGDLDIGTLYIGTKVKTIGAEAFHNCSSIDIMTFLGDAPTFGDGALGDEYMIVNYPVTNATWTEEILTADYGATLVWTPYGSAEGNVASGTFGESLSWVLDGEGVLTISGTGTMPAYTLEEHAPWYDYCSQIVSIVVEEGITNIGAYAFRGTKNMVSISLPDTLVSIDEYGIAYCTSLVTVDIPDSVKTIGSYAFDDCRSLAHLTIGSGVETIGTYAFSSCPSIAIVKIPASVKTIGDYAFAYLGRLSAIQVEDGNTAYCNDAHGVLYSKDMTKIVQFPMYRDGTYTIAGTVTGIGNGAFYNATKLDGVTIPDGVKTIGEAAFYACYDLAAITIPDSVETIGESAFEHSTGLETVVIGDGVTTIMDSAFAYCQSIIDITFGEGLKTIENSAFEYCYRMPSVILPDGLTTIEDSAFYGCNALAELYLGKSLTYLGYRAFYSCDALTSVTIPDTVTSVGESVFYDNPSLETVNLGTGLKVLGYCMFSNCPKLTAVKIPEGVIGIDYGTFQNCTGLVSITLPESMTSIGNNAFKGCTALTTCNIPAGMTDIGNYAFHGCTSLKGITLTEGLTKLGAAAFAETGLTEITIPASIGNISTQAFSDCVNLAKVTISTGVKEIGYNSFFGCTSLAAVDIPDSVTYVGGNSFSGCTGLKKIAFQSDAPYIATNTFTDVVADASYPGGNDTWTEAKLQNYGGTIAWIPCYFIIEGNDSSVAAGSNQDIKIRADGDYSKFECVKLNGQIVDPEKYTVSEGSTIIAFHGEYIKTLPEGTYTVEVVFSDGSASTNLTVTEPEELAKFDIPFANMTLANSLAMNFAFAQSHTDDWTGYYAEIVKTYADGREDAVTRIPAAQWGQANIGGAYYTITFNGIAAKEMTDKFYVTIYNAEGEAVSNTREDSVRDYATRTLNSNSSNAETKTMIVDMLNYGAAAQSFFKYNTADLANGKLTEAQKALATQTTETADGRVKGEKYLGTSLTLESKILLNMAFQGATSDMYAEITYTDHYGADKKAQAAITASGSVGVVAVDQIAVADARQPVTVTVYNADGSVYGTATDSVEGYIARMGDSDALFKLIMKFADSAYAFFH